MLVTLPTCADVTRLQFAPLLVERAMPPGDAKLTPASRMVEDGEPAVLASTTIVKKLIAPPPDTLMPFVLLVVQLLPPLLDRSTPQPSEPPLASPVPA